MSYWLVYFPVTIKLTFEIVWKLRFFFAHLERDNELLEKALVAAPVHRHEARAEQAFLTVNVIVP
jgi:hypothetical protein